jgi:TonB family protein
MNVQYSLDEVIPIAIVITGAFATVIAVLVGKVHRTWAFWTVIVVMIAQVALNIVQLERNEKLVKEERTIRSDSEKENKAQMAQMLLFADRQQRTIEQMQRSLTSGTLTQPYIQSVTELRQHLDSLIHTQKDHAKAPPRSDAFVNTKTIPPAETGVTAPIALFTPEPDYTDEARNAHLEGIVELECIVGTTGQVGPNSIKITHSLGMGLDEQAITAVKKWLFIPSKRDGQPVPVSMRIEAAFHLYSR